MILSRCIDFIEELLLTLFKSLSPLLLRAFSIALFFLELLLELIVIFFGKGFNSKSYLLLEIISWILRERPSHKLLNWDNILGKWLRLGCNCGSHWIWQSDLHVNVGPWILEDIFKRLFRLNPSFNSIFSSLLNHRRTGLKEDSLFCFQGTRIKQVFEWNPSSTKCGFHIYGTTSLRCSLRRCTFSCSSSLRNFLLRWKLHEFNPASLFTDNLLFKFNDFKSLFFTDDMPGIGPSLKLADLMLNILILFTVGLKSAKLSL